MSDKMVRTGAFQSALADFFGPKGLFEKFPAPLGLLFVVFAKLACGMEDAVTDRVKRCERLPRCV